MVILLGIMEDAIAGNITEEMRKVAKDEGKTPEFICRGIASGKIVIPVSPYRYTRPVGIGKGLRTKVNASIGTSSDIVNADMEVDKAKSCRDLRGRYLNGAFHWGRLQGDSLEEL